MLALVVRLRHLQGDRVARYFLKLETDLGCDSRSHKKQRDHSSQEAFPLILGTMFSTYGIN